MASYNLALLTKKLYESGFCLLTTKTLRDIFEIPNENTFFKTVNKLRQQKILTKIERNKYLLSSATVNTFELANFLYSPSYVSFESALNFHSILPQFPYEISSATLKKSKSKKWEKKVFVYYHLKKKLFFGYFKKNNFLIAYPEKALLDQLYFVAKGLKSLNLDECDFSSINKMRLKEFLRLFPRTSQFNRIVEELSKFARL